MMLIETLLTPEEVAMIKPADVSPPLLRNRILFKVAFISIRFYYAFKAIIVKRIPMAGSFLGASFSIAGDALIDSWRDGFDRRPFYIPKTATGGWCKEPGMNHNVRRAIRSWRSELFNTVFKGLAVQKSATLIAVLIAFGCTIYGVWYQHDWLGITLIGTGAGALTCGFGWIFCATLLTNRVKKVVARRPGPKEPGIDVPTY